MACIVKSSWKVSNAMIIITSAAKLAMLPCHEVRVHSRSTVRGEINEGHGAIQVQGGDVPMVSCGARAVCSIWTNTSVLFLRGGMALPL